MITFTRARLFSGLSLFGYAVTHLMNHALGLVSLAAAGSGRAVFVAFWRFPPVEATLLAALLLHAGLGVWSLWQRRSLRMGATDALQITMGLLIPTYLAAHVMGTGWLHRCCGVTDSYSFILGRAWPHGIGTLTVMLLLVWLHGTIGLHFWARLYPVYRRLQPWLLMVATLIPVLALAGVISGGRELAARRSTDAAAWAMLAVQQNWPSDAQRAAWVDGPAQWVERGFEALASVNRKLKTELDEPLRMGMGVHLGTVILGEIGHGRARSLTAIGDAVNVASRLEALTKELGCQLVVSQSVTDHAGIGFLRATRRDVDVRGRTGRLAMLLVTDAAELPPLPVAKANRYRGWQRALGSLRSKLRRRSEAPST